MKKYIYLVERPNADWDEYLAHVICTRNSTTALNLAKRKAEFSEHSKAWRYAKITLIGIADKKIAEGIILSDYKAS